MSSSSSSDSGETNRLRAQLAAANQQLTLCQADRQKLMASAADQSRSIDKLTADLAVARSKPLDQDVNWLTLNTIALARILRLPPGPTGNDPGPAVTLTNLQTYAASIMTELDRLRSQSRVP